ncbi:hypothetical protein [Bdellovibrio sp. HCB209]|uniref:hypothetical protein n=1 Tax=Bdellovibrio sp. HCB209 TaxID=3394354 RepID=UPI0039B63E9B
MRNWLVGALLLASVSAKADLTLSSRYEYIGGENKEELANRLLLHSRLSAGAGRFTVFAEGFGDFDGAKEPSEERRSPHRGYLQEAYVELKTNSSYIRVGQQAMRWSDSWVVPSLDVWTGRRYNRLFFDPFADQLTHSQGVSYSYESESFGLDLVGVSKMAQTYYPEPLPETMTSDKDSETGYGGRIKINGKGIGFTALAAKAAEKNIYGMTANYAFEKAVPKIELGGSQDNSVNADPDYKDEYFGSLGVDLFLGNFVILPMVTFYDSGRFSTSSHDYKTLYYMSMVWNPNRHDLQAQVYYNSVNQDAFASLSYGYNVTDWSTLTGFVQYYEGDGDTLFAIYKNMTGGSVVGVRFEITGNLPF